MIKNNKKLIIGFILGAIMFTSLGVCAATILSGREITYDNTNSKLSSTNVQDAIDELNNKATTKIEEARKECPDGYTCTPIPKYYAFGLPDTTSPTNYNDVIASSGSNTFVQLEGEQLSVCIYRNNTLECFKNNNYEEEVEHLKQVFGEDSCGVYSSSAYCDDDVFDCHVTSDGDVSCSDDTAGHYCYLYADGRVICE